MPQRRRLLGRVPTVSDSKVTLTAGLHVDAVEIVPAEVVLDPVAIRPFLTRCRPQALCGTIWCDFFGLAPRDAQCRSPESSSDPPLPVPVGSSSPAGAVDGTTAGTWAVSPVVGPVTLQIVGYSIDSRMQSRIAVAALNNAVARRDGDVSCCIVHSDRGSQLRDHGSSCPR